MFAAALTTILTQSVTALSAPQTNSSMAQVVRVVRLTVHPVQDCPATVRHVSLHFLFRLTVFAHAIMDIFTTAQVKLAQWKLSAQQENI
jgi:hypothetical protein